MASATFEEHPTDPDKMIMRKPRLDQGADYERGFVDGMQYQMQTSVDKAVNAMSQQGEPVGRFAKFTDDIWREVTDYSAGVPLYTTPQQRTWVGLTDEEMLECNMDGDIMIDRETAKRNVEAKLKEKNI